MASEIELPKGTAVPNHIAMILDGNRRWARARGLKPWQGHLYGFKSLVKLAEASRDLGVHTFTVWAFSTENWERPQKEIDAIMNIFRRALKEKEKEFHRDRIALVHLGRKDRLPEDIKRELTRIEAETAKYSGNHIFNVAVDYGGRDEILRAAQEAIDAGVKKLDEKTFEKYLDTYGQPYPDPDLFIRTSGEQRTSGLLPWQMVYSEYYFEPIHLPDFTPEKLKEAVLDYSRRRRRFGGNDALEHFTFRPEVVARLELDWWRLAKVPEGTSFMQYAVRHLKEQFGLSKKLAKDAAKLMVEAAVEENRNKFDKAAGKLKKFYKLIKEEVKLAFEPKIVASLEIEMRRQRGEGEEATKEYLAEVYRISLFQAAKAAHLRVLANIAKNRGDWESAEDYLQKYYSALKERVA